MFSFVPRPRHNIGGSWQLWDRLLRLSHQGLRSLAGDPALSREASIRNAGSPGLQRQWREAHRTATSENASVWCGLTLEAFRGRRCASLSETGQGPDMGHEGRGERRNRGDRPWATDQGWEWFWKAFWKNGDGVGSEPTGGVWETVGAEHLTEETKG